MSLKTEIKKSTLLHLKWLYVISSKIRKIFCLCKFKSTMIHVRNPQFRIAERVCENKELSEKKLLNYRTNSVM